MNYKKAFKCSKCPQSNTGDGCPNWLEFMQTNIHTGEDRLTKMCGYQAMPMFMTEVIRASNRPAAEIGALRGDMIQALANSATHPDMKVLEHD
jgi:hypothetical protein